MTSNDSSPSTIASSNNLYHTKVNMMKFNYLWTIENFSKCQHNNLQALKSPLFRVAPDHEAKWSLEIFPRGSFQDVADNVSVHLRLVESQEPVRINFTISILNVQKEKLNEKGWHKNALVQPESNWGFKDYIKRETLFDPSKGFLTNDALNIYFELTAGEEVALPEPVSLFECNFQVHVEEYRTVISTTLPKKTANAPTAVTEKKAMVPNPNSVLRRLLEAPIYKFEKEVKKEIENDENDAGFGKSSYFDNPTTSSGFLM